MISKFVLLGLAALVAAAPKPTAEYPADVQVTPYPDGLPEAIKPEIVSNGTDVEKRDDLEKRQNNAGVYLCNDRNFGGYCVHIVAPLYACVNLGADLNDQVSSVGPDSPFYCQFYSNFNCNDNEGHFGTFSPGYSDLSSSGAPGSYWNDRISSYFCNPN